jgi:hypothetical protein
MIGRGGRRVCRPAARSQTHGKLLKIGGLPEAGRRPAAGEIARPPTWFSSPFVGRLQFAAVLLCLMLGGCGSLTRHGPLDPALSVFIPPDTVALAGVNLDRLRATPLYGKLAVRNRLPAFDAFGADAHDVMLASDGKHLLAMARGGFPEQKASETEGITFIGHDIALFGEVAAVRAAIDQSKRGGRGAPRDLMARAQALPADTQIWAVVAGWRGATPDQLRAMGNWGNLDRVFRMAEGASLTVDLRTRVHAAFLGDCRTEADAKNLADSLRGLAALAPMGAPHSVPGIQVAQEGRVVRVNIDLAEDLAEKLVR